MSLKRWVLKCSLCGLFIFGIGTLSAQVNGVQFGRNRIQYKKFNWRFYQSANFNTYFNQGGLELGKFVTQIAENQLHELEILIGKKPEGRLEIIVYNSFDDMRSTNIGLENRWYNSAGDITLVNNKLVIYFNGDHANLSKQVRHGIAEVLLNPSSLNYMPAWMANGYLDYVVENWNSTKDNQLKNVILGGTYQKFNRFALEQPKLAGQSFWYFIEDHYNTETLEYFYYSLSLLKNVNQACIKVFQKSYKDLCLEFFDFEEQKYYKDIRQRRGSPKGSMVTSEDISPDIDIYHYEVNPNPRNYTFAFAQFVKGRYSVSINENFGDITTLIHNDVKNLQAAINPNYPLLSWDGKGTRLSVVYWEKGKIRLLIYDLLAHSVINKRVIEGLDQVTNAKFMLDANTLLLSGVKNGFTDLFILKLNTDKLEQLTADVYDDLDASFASFPSKSGILFSSNRPSANAPIGDSILPNNYKQNIYLLDYLTKNQISQLSNLQNGNARSPAQYNLNHFTFLTDENGINNRWAGFFNTKRNGVDSLFIIGDETVRNPSPQALDSALAFWQKDKPDSVVYFSITSDSTYTFPISNYQNSVLETSISGNNNQLSEVMLLGGDYKALYKLRFDPNVLTQRNVSARPSIYMQKELAKKRLQSGATINATPENNAAISKPKPAANFFQNEFSDTSSIKKNIEPLSLKATQAYEAKKKTVLLNSKLFNYRLKFVADAASGGLTNTVLINTLQPYANGQGPIILGTGNDLNLNLQASLSDVMEDIKITGGVVVGLNLVDNSYFANFQNLRRRLDWGVTFYRTSNSQYAYNNTNLTQGTYSTSLLTNLYQGNLSYPLDEVNSIRLNIGYRRDLVTFKPNQLNPVVAPLSTSDVLNQYAVPKSKNWMS